MDRSSAMGVLLVSHAIKAGTSNLGKGELPPYHSYYCKFQMCAGSGELLAIDGSWYSAGAGVRSWRSNKSWVCSLHKLPSVQFPMLVVWLSLAIPFGFCNGILHLEQRISFFASQGRVQLLPESPGNRQCRMRRSLLLSMYYDTQFNETKCSIV